VSNPWFRMYSEFANDPKVQRLSETDQRRFVMLLCIRCSNGDVTLQDEDVTFQLRISDEEWQATKVALLSKNLIGKDNKPSAWEKRQFSSDTSAARVAKHRALHNEQSNGDVTLPKRKSNVPEQNRTEQNRIDKSLDTDPLKDAIESFKKHRKALKKPMTEKAIQLFEKELDSLAGKGFDPIGCINTAILNGWQTVYPPKDGANKSSASNLGAFV